LALFGGMAPHERIGVLLALLGAHQQRVTLPEGDVRGAAARRRAQPGAFRRPQAEQVRIMRLKKGP
jgi:hypothetical protein